MGPSRSTLAVSLPLLVISAFGLSGCSPSPGPSVRMGEEPTTAEEESVTVELVRGDHAGRRYTARVPADGSEPVPVILALHPYGGTVPQAQNTFGLDVPAAAAGFATVYPSGPGKSWNAGSCCGEAAAEDRDDVGFLEAVVDDLAARYDVDTERVYVTGFSNGAMMAYRLACESDVAAAIAPVGGAVMTDCTEPDPLPVLHIHGTADGVVPPDGSEGTSGIDPQLTVEEGAALLAGGDEPEVVLLDGLDHTWPNAHRTDGAYEAQQEIVSFFAAQP